jgi:hypothetical protein
MNLSAWSEVMLQYSFFRTLHKLFGLLCEMNIGIVEGMCNILNNLNTNTKNFGDSATTRSGNLY